jgi:hypothetical protein
MKANILAYGTSFFAPISVPVGTMPHPLFTFAAALFATAGILLAVGDFTAHDSCLSSRVSCTPGIGLLVHPEGTSGGNVATSLKLVCMGFSDNDPLSVHIGRSGSPANAWLHCTLKSYRGLAYYKLSDICLTNIWPPVLFLCHAEVLDRVIKLRYSK